MTSVSEIVPVADTSRHDKIDASDPRADQTALSTTKRAHCGDRSVDCFQPLLQAVAHRKLEVDVARLDRRLEPALVDFLELAGLDHTAQCLVGRVSERS